MSLTDVRAGDMVQAVPKHARNVLSIGEKESIQIGMRRSQRPATVGTMLQVSGKYLVVRAGLKTYTGWIVFRSHPPSWRGREELQGQHNKG